MPLPPIQRSWFEDGPLVRVEFVRQSKNNRNFIRYLRRVHHVFTAEAVMQIRPITHIIAIARFRLGRRKVGKDFLLYESPGWIGSMDLKKSSTDQKIFTKYLKKRKKHEH